MRALKEMNIFNDAIWLMKEKAIFLGSLVLPQPASQHSAHQFIPPSMHFLTEA